MNYRKTLVAFFLGLALISTACSKRVEVTILPTKYVVGTSSFDIATPAVDEVVKLKPSEVHIHACTSTPPTRILQFNTELDARQKTNKTMSFTAQGC
ncbi:MAG: hypothetical protein PHX60_15530 [Giesbergeria sp.]|uniref:hypothetical protein n=1 Tax=Giesbergeria sp. TaxID=2818473 RepID=UPI0026151266|nr:hypothetical protein [Giesbergeria sp.]MDD2611064.1 hypothetical protein [Giesbergeria sp.]